MKNLKFFVFRVLVACLLLSLEAVEGKCAPGEKCVTDLDQTDCEDGYYVTEGTGLHQCCPSCTKIPPKPERCGGPFVCPVGTICVEGICVSDKTSCRHIHYLDENEKSLYLPKCDPDGTYAAVQCKGDALAGRCFCTSPNGRRIFGMSWMEKSQDMTCACSRRRAELEASGRTDVTLHCSENGNYEQLQCDSGICWCVEEKTGEPTSTATAEDLVAQLPCYDVETYGSQYLRICESKAHAIAVMKNLLAQHGTVRVTMETVNCDYDGSYGVYQIERGIAFCSWVDGSRIGGWQSDAGVNLESVNCNCARDTKYFEQVDKFMNQICDGNGNYMPKQQLNGLTYCVDGDGYPTTELSEDGANLHCA